MAENGKDETAKVLTVEEATADLLVCDSPERSMQSKYINERVKALNADRGAAQAALTQAVAQEMQEDERKSSCGSATTLTEVPQVPDQLRAN